MCEVKVASLLKVLADDNNKKRIDGVNELLESFKKEENLLNDIVIYLLKNIGSAGTKRKELVESLRITMESMDKETLVFTLMKMKEHLFLTKIKDSTKGQLTNNRLGSILSFDALLMSTEISKIDKDSFNYFFEFVLSLIDDNSLGFIAVLTIINFFKRASSKDNQSNIKKLKDEIFKLENLVDHPQYLLLWLSFSDEQKKILKSSSKEVPSIQSKDVLNKLPDVFKSCKEDQLRTLINYISTNSSFPVVWKFLYDNISSEVSHSKLKHILLMSFEAVCPQKAGLIDQLTNEKRVSLINKIWNNELIINLILKQLSDTTLDMHYLCQKFVFDLCKINDFNVIVLEEWFKIILIFGKQFVSHESKINQTLRLSHILLRHLKSNNIYRNYINLIVDYFGRVDKCHEKIYALEQLSAAFVKCSARDEFAVETLLNINYNYNHQDTSRDIGLIEAARSALLRCLETIGNNNLDQLNKLLIISSTIYVNEDLNAICHNLLQFFQSTGKSKKRTASQQNTKSIDLTNKTNEMFISLLAHLCLYVGSQPFDEEIMDMISDISTCFNKFRGISDDKSSVKRSKSDVPDVNDNISNQDWTIVFADVLIVLLEQNCHYLRTLAVNAFKSLVVEDLCDLCVIDHINGIIEKTETETKQIDKKNAEGEQMNDGDDIDSDLSADSDDDEEMEVDNENGDLKARIFAALGTVNADVDSDCDDNCPVIDDDDMDSSSDNDNTEGMSTNKPKVSLKEKRHTVLQLRQFRNRCLDLLETVFLNAPKLADRLAAFLLLLKRLNKSNDDMEKRLIRSTNIFKKFQTKQDISTEEMICHINKLIDGIQQCSLTRNVLQIFSAMIVTFLRMKKEEMAVIVESFKPIIDQCVTEKKKNPLKAIFLGAFDIFPELSWAFHGQMLQYVGSDQLEQVQFQAIGILRKIITNQAMKNVVFHGEVNSFVSKSEILLFVNQFGEIIRSIILKIDIAKHPKYSALIIGSLIDCLKLGGHLFYQTLEESLLDKIKGVPKSSLPKDLVKTLNQFVAAVDCAKKSVKEI